MNWFDPTTRRRTKKKKKAIHLGGQQFATFTRLTPCIPGQFHVTRYLIPPLLFILSGRRQNKLLLHLLFLVSYYIYLLDHVWLKHKHDESLRGTTLWEQIAWLVSSGGRQLIAFPFTLSWKIRILFTQSLFGCNFSHFLQQTCFKVWRTTIAVSETLSLEWVKHFR